MGTIQVTERVGGRSVQTVRVCEVPAPNTDVAVSLPTGFGISVLLHATPQHIFVRCGTNERTDDVMAIEVLLLIFLGTAAACTLSASAGLGGSLVLVPLLALTLGTKEGVALAALLLAANNLVKLIAYRRSIPWRKSVVVLVLVVLGSALGAWLLVLAPESWVSAAVVVSIVVALFAERLRLSALQKFGVPALALASGATSGFSGTSGPLKGVALRMLRLDRVHLVGAASVVSLAGDATKASIYAEAGLLSAQSLLLMAVLFPVMIGSTFLGRYLNSKVGERGYSVLFWVVMGGYSLRLVGVAP